MKHLCVLLSIWMPLAFLALAASGDPIPSGGEFQINTYTLDQQDGALVTARPDGGFVVHWESYGQDGLLEGVFLQRLANDGTFEGTETQVNTETVNHQEDASIAYASDGSYIVVWDSAAGQDGSRRGIFGQRYDAAGAVVGDEFQVNIATTGEQNDAVIAAHPDGGFVVVWETDDITVGMNEDLVGLRLDASGMAVGGEFNINAFSSGDQEDAAIATAPSGIFTVVWESDGFDGSYDSIVARRFLPDGTALGIEFAVNTYTTGPQANPEMAMHHDGSFVIVWEDYAQDMFDDSIMGRYFDATGTPTTGEFQVDSYTGGYQIDPNVALDPRGHALVVWQSWMQDGAEGGVFFNRFDKTGAPELTEMQVNTETAANQVAAAVSHNDGKILVVWESQGAQDGSADGIFGQLYIDSVHNDGFEAGDLAAWTSTVPPLP